MNNMAFTPPNRYEYGTWSSYNTVAHLTISEDIGSAAMTEVSEVLKSSPKKKKKIDVRKLNKSLLNL